MNKKRFLMLMFKLKKDYFMKMKKIWKSVKKNQLQENIIL